MEMQISFVEKNERNTGKLMVGLFHWSAQAGREMLNCSAMNVVPGDIQLEMSKESLLNDGLLQVGNINLFLANNPYELTQGKKEAWQQAVNELSKSNLKYMTNPVRLSLSEGKN